MSWTAVLRWGVVLVVAAMAAVPLAILLLSGFKPPGSLPFDAVPFTLQNIVTIYRDPSTYRLLFNTVIYACGSLALGLVIALCFAWLLERTDLPGKPFFQSCMFVQMVVPTIVIAMSWILLLGPRAGMLNQAIRQIFGLTGDGPFDVLSLAGMILITASGIFPSMFVMIAGLLRNMDPALEEAARMSGADSATVLRRVTIPLLGPGIASTIIYFSIVMLEAFDVALVIGLTIGFPVLSTRIYTLTQSTVGRPDYGLASALAFIGVTLGAVLVAIYLRLTQHAQKYAIVGGKGFRPRLTLLGMWRWPLFSITIAFLSIQMLLPIAAVAWNSLLPFYQPPSVAALGAISLQAYKTVFMQDPRIPGIIVNTIVLIVGAATICMTLSSVVAWLIVRSRGTLTRILDFAAFLPSAVPGVVLALALLLAAVGTPLYGTVGILMLGQVIRYLPFGTRMMQAAQLQIHRELEEAATMSGAGWIGMYRRVLLPLLATPFSYGWLWVATHSVRDVTIPLLLLSVDNTVVASLLWEYWGWGKTPEASAIAVVLLALTAAVTLPALWLRSDMREQRI